MGAWIGIEAESEGLIHAWSNLRGDSAAMANYAYDRMSAYVGPSHPDVCKELLQRMIGIAAGEPSDGPLANRRDETPPPDDVNEVLAWEGPEKGWTTAYRGGENRDGVGSPELARDLDWWVWSFGITAKFTWWSQALPAPTRDDDKPAELKPPSVSIVTANGNILAVKATEYEAEDAVADLLSETGFEIVEDDIDIEVWVIGDVATPDEGPDQVF